MSISKVPDKGMVIETVNQEGRRIYEEKLKALLEPQHKGRFVAIEPTTGEYYLGDTDAEALLTAHAAQPESRFYLKRIGYDYTHKIGSYGIHHGSTSLYLVTT